MRWLMALVLCAALVWPVGDAQAERSHGHLRIPVSPAYVAAGVAALVTGARIVVALYAGNTLLGGRIGTSLMAIYLAHVVAEGAIYGAGAGAGALIAQHSAAPGSPEARPVLRLDRLIERLPSSRLPLQFGRIR